MNRASLASLPDDALLDIIDHVQVARDAANFGQASKHMNSFMQQRGWKAFVKARFPLIDPPVSEHMQWHHLADRLTYLDRCWDKRGFLLNFFSEQLQKQQPRQGRRPGSKQQSVPFHPVIHSCSSPSLDTELVVWGAGQDLILRSRHTRAKVPDVWNRVLGSANGYASGIDDITAVTIVQRGQEPEVVVGRAMGHLELLSTSENDYGTKTQALTTNDKSMSFSAMQSVTWTEWRAQNNMLASCQATNLMLHNLGNADADSAELEPMAIFDVANSSTSQKEMEDPFLRRAKFLINDIVACALGGSREPLRWLQIHPAGITTLHSVLANGDDQGSLGKKTTVRTIEAVGAGSQEALLLSAWDDGSYRLIDMRTPTQADAVYRDRFQPYQAGSSLLVYGMERFVAGSNHAPDLRFFDFRYPKAYFHSTSLACSDKFPRPDAGGQNSTSGPDAGRSDPIAQCDNQRSVACHWHENMRRPLLRPDATLHVGNQNSYDRVFSLAKSSDASDTFYCGLSGTVVEVSLTLAEHITKDTSGRTAPPGWYVGDVKGRISLQETGIGRCKDGEISHDDIIGIQRLWHQNHEWQKSGGFRSQTTNRSRLDSAFEGT